MNVFSTKTSIAACVAVFCVSGVNVSPSFVVARMLRGTRQTASLESSMDGTADTSVLEQVPVNRIGRFELRPTRGALVPGKLVEADDVPSCEPFFDTRDPLEAFFADTVPHDLLDESIVDARVVTKDEDPFFDALTRTNSALLLQNSRREGALDETLATFGESFASHEDVAISDAQLEAFHDFADGTDEITKADLAKWFEKMDTKLHAEDILGWVEPQRDSRARANFLFASFKAHCTTDTAIVDLPGFRVYCSIVAGKAKTAQDLLSSIYRKFSQ